MESWFSRPRGQYLLGREEELASELLELVFGYNQLQLGASGNQPLALGSHLSHKIYCSPAAGEQVGLVSAPDSLPFSNDSIDTVLLHHALEFSDSPHSLLREAHRVLVPQGHIIIMGFNPRSLYGAAARVRRLFPDSFWRRSHSISVSRLKDWLHLLGAEVQQVQHCFALPPAGGERLFRWLSHSDALMTRYRLPLGGVYAIHARKVVSTLTPNRIRWRQPVGARLIGLTVPKPVASPCEGDVAA